MTTKYRVWMHGQYLCGNCSYLLYMHKRTGYQLTGSCANKTCRMYEKRLRFRAYSLVAELVPKRKKR